MKIKAVEHISINTNNFERSDEFYGQILGFKHLELVDCGEFDIHYYAIPGGSRLELFDYHGKATAVDHPENDTGLRHLAFEVEDVAEHEKELRSKGVQITLPVTDLPNLHARVLLFMDPNGVTLEFCEKI